MIEDLKGRLYDVCVKHRVIVTDGSISGDLVKQHAFMQELFAAAAQPALTQRIDQQTHSDCYLACLASLTGLSVKDMPQPPTTFEELTQGGEPSATDYEAERQYGVSARTCRNFRSLCRIGPIGSANGRVPSGSCCRPSG